MKQNDVAKSLRERFRAKDVWVKRVPPEEGPAAPVWEATGEVLAAVPSVQGLRPVRLVVRAVAKRLERLPEAWEAALRRARADLGFGVHQIGG